MEGSAKGQLGGMEMGEEERRRLAEGSKTWKCLGCGGRSNEEILREVEGSCEGERVEGKKDEVPDGLKLGYREDFSKRDDSEKRGQKVPPEPQTDKPQPQLLTRIEPIPPIRTTNNSPPPQPTRTIPLPQPTSQSPSPSDAIPTWIDKAIVGVVASLAVMVIKKVVV